MFHTTLRAIASGALAVAAVTAGTTTPAMSAGLTTPAAGSPWRHYEVPVQGRKANLTSVVAPGRNDAWAAGFMTNFSTPGLASPDAARAKPEDDDVAEHGPSALPETKPPSP
ncbi:hypothetical protein GCM10029978_110720 [Actinoallomurus acanthiterrae]